MDNQNQDVPEVVPEVQVEEKEEPKRRVKQVEVRAINPLAFRDADYVLVVNVSDPTEAWLLDKDEVPNSAASFKVKETVLAAAPRPATFEEVLAEELPTAESVMLALWNVGVVTHNDLGNTQKVRNALNRVAPSPASFSKYKVED